MQVLPLSSDLRVSPCILAQITKHLHDLNHSQGLFIVTWLEQTHTCHLTYLQLNLGRGRDHHVRQQLEAPSPEALVGHGDPTKLVRTPGSSVPMSAPATSARNQASSKKLYLKLTQKRNRAADPKEQNAFFPPLRWAAMLSHQSRKRSSIFTLKE